jgi:RHS repeat-associated protein
MTQLVCPSSCQAENNTWDVAARLPTILNDGTNGNYVYGLDLVSLEGTRFFSYDGLDSTTDVTDSTGTTIASYTYDVFGAVRAQSGIPIANEWLFTGEQQEYNISSLYYLRARHYDSATGRFLSQDPLPGSVTNPQTQNAYAYVGSNPVNRIDPTGMVWAEGGITQPYSIIACHVDTLCGFSSAEPGHAPASPTKSD